MRHGHSESDERYDDAEGVAAGREPQSTERVRMRQRLREHREHLRGGRSGAVERLESGRRAPAEDRRVHDRPPPSRSRRSPPPEESPPAREKGGRDGGDRGRRSARRKAPSTKRRGGPGSSAAAAAASIQGLCRGHLLRARLGQRVTHELTRQIRYMEDLKESMMEEAELQHDSDRLLLTRVGAQVRIGNAFEIFSLVCLELPCKS